MSAHPNKRSTKWIAAFAAAGVLAVTGAGSAAFAADLTTVDDSKVGSITVHKYELPDTGFGPEVNGKELAPADVAGLTPLEGVTFTFERLTEYDLTTNAGWTSLQGLSLQDAIDTATKVLADTVTTDAGGLAVAADLPLGAYLVTETAAPTGVIATKPFVITVPLTDPDNSNAWMYDLHVYPKNQIANAEKTTEDSEATAIGDDVVWSILGDIPVSDPIDGYKIVDELDPRLSYDPANPAVLSLDGSSTTLVEGVDYTLTAVQNAGAWTITAEFTAAGRAKLVTVKAADIDARVKLVIPTTVNSIGDGNIENTALVYPNLPSFDITPGEPGGPLEPTDETKWGKVEILKHEQGDKAELLAGAQFQVFTSQADADAQTNPVTINGQDTWTTAANGVTSIEGLRQSGWADGAAVAPGEEGYQEYWIVEVKAPAGYELLAEPIKVTVGDPTTQAIIEVPNALDNGGFELPFTGGEFNSALLYGAGSIILAGVVLMAVRRRKAAADN